MIFAPTASLTPVWWRSSANTAVYPHRRATDRNSLLAPSRGQGQADGLSRGQEIFQRLTGAPGSRNRLVSLFQQRQQLVPHRPGKHRLQILQRSTTEVGVIGM